MMFYFFFNKQMINAYDHHCVYIMNKFIPSHSIQIKKKTKVRKQQKQKNKQISNVLVFGELRDGRAPTGLLVPTREPRHRQKLLLSGPASRPQGGLPHG
jgi:hypothetical protein